MGDGGQRDTEDYTPTKLPSTPTTATGNGGSVVVAGGGGGRRSLSYASSGRGYDREPALYQGMEVFCFGQNGLASRVFSGNNEHQRAREIRNTLSDAEVLRKRCLRGLHRLIRQGYAKQYTSYIDAHGEKKTLPIFPNLKRGIESLSHMLPLY